MRIGKKTGYSKHSTKQAGYSKHSTEQARFLNIAQSRPDILYITQSWPDILYITQSGPDIHCITQNRPTSEEEEVWSSFSSRRMASAVVQWRARDGYLRCSVVIWSWEGAHVSACDPWQQPSSEHVNTHVKISNTRPLVKGFLEWNLVTL